jgi:hypothetical protein
VRDNLRKLIGGYNFTHKFHQTLRRRWLLRPLQRHLVCDLLS